MMLDEQWKELKYFGPKEPWGTPSFMDFDFLKMLDNWRGYVGTPFIVHNAYETEGHAKDSQHKKIPTKVVDGHFKDYKVSPLKAYIAADRFGFNGIGLYPNKGRWFIHLDHRDEIGAYKKRWIRNDEGVYYSLNEKTFYEFMWPIEQKYH